jgi:hypothetical protein
MKRLLNPGQILASIILLFSVFSCYAFAGATTQFSTSLPSGVEAALELQANPLLSMKPTPFKLTIKDSQGAAIRGLSITSDMTMPAMAMPPNNPKVNADAQAYAGEILFTMAGAWQAEFVCKAADGESFSLVFDIPQVKMK